jgi:hypothetical protein
MNSDEQALALLAGFLHPLIAKLGLLRDPGCAERGQAGRSRLRPIRQRCNKIRIHGAFPFNLAPGQEDRNAPVACSTRGGRIVAIDGWVHFEAQPARRDGP